MSRLEAARGLATPLLVAVKVQTALVAALREVDPAILSDELRAMVEAEHVGSFRTKSRVSLFAVPDGLARAGDATMRSREARAVAARSGTPPTHGLTPMRAQLARLTRRELRAAPRSEG